MSESQLELLSDDTTTANSGIVMSDDRQAIVELDPDHPGFRDDDYRARRNTIAQIAVEHEPGTPVPDAPYTEEEHLVWRTVWESMAPAHARHACHEYLLCSERMGLPRDRIPQLQEVSARVERLSGFRLEPVGGLVHPKVFLSTLAGGVFLSTQYIRHHSTPLYTPEPDVMHEVVGHATTLASPHFARINRLIGAAAARTESDESLERLGRIYWYTVEFGVLREEGELRAYGAGLLSSFGEIEAMTDAELRPLDFEGMQALPYDVTKYQPVLFCADSFEQLTGALGDYLEAWEG
jgi:phenylalanine-4-hydroxylase